MTVEFEPASGSGQPNQIPAPTNPTTDQTAPTSDPSASDTPAADFVSRSDHQRAIQDMLKFKREAQALREEREAEQTRRLKENNQWKEVAEAKEREAAEAKSESKRLQESYLSDKKFNAVRTKCMAMGLRPEASADLELLDLSDVTIETTSTGKINLLGVERYAEWLKTNRPHWFADSKAPPINTGGPRVIDDSTEITVTDIQAAEREGRKTGDMSKYHELHKRFQTQRQTRHRTV